ncbi:hypothetical protein B0H16DRAFT_1512507 [Mycena metata]|uniref:Uncharacterized protein n=1 Tax=Mycena metata TaxID=1033252 RepID=A0AAD7NSW3_9AGAR|nr:hypothetical protein B0H16DRAFT_1512507 [Mycena metata]
MTTISIDIAAIFREIRLTVREITNERAAANEKRKAAQLLVYRALSLRPALDHMKPPTGMLADVDWYTELRATFSAGIFRRLGQNEHFKRMASLGGTGARARIMLLLLWIIGHRLSEDSVARLLSTAFGDAIKRDDSENQDLENEINALVSVKEVLVSLRKMIKRKLPLPSDRNPFLGHDYTPEDEDKPLPRSELWGYALPEDERYEYDVRNNPALLIRPLPGKTIIPQTKLTILIIQWAACNFGLGKKVYSAEDIDPDAFWNADPPPAAEHDGEDEDEDRLSLSSFSSRGSFVLEIHEGAATAPYDAEWQDDPTEDWVHSRFCSVYPLHGWVHRSFVRVLLFNSFCGTQTLPEPSEILGAVHVADRLVQRLPPDIWDYAQQFIIARALLFSEAENKTQTWDPVFAELSPRERGNTVIFVDALRWIEAARDVGYPPWLKQTAIFLQNPRALCQDAPDILALPTLSSRDTRSSMNVLPKLDPSTCICGECALIEAQQPSSLESFRSQYLVVMSSRPQGCEALARTWEPLISTAETWLDALLSRVESQFALFPDVDRRMGPAVLETANAMGVVVGSLLSDQDLLRFFVALCMLQDHIPVAIPKPPGPFGLGYVVTLPWTADREDYKADVEGPDRVLFATGGWLYDSIGTEGITLLHQGDEFKVVYRTNMPGKFSAVCMPQFKGDFVSLFPDLLPVLTQGALAGSEAIEEQDNTMELTLVLSRLPTDGFPLLSVCSETAFAAPRGSLAALVRVKCLDRVLETVWRPDLKRGSPCEHTASWRRATRQSLTATDLIGRVLPPSDSSTDVPTLTKLAFASSDEVAAQSQQRLREMMEALSRRVEPLTVAGSPLERTRAVIVRCGVKDGPVDAVAVLSASVRKKVYIFDRSECWECALIRMSEDGRSVGISIDTKY